MPLSVSPYYANPQIGQIVSNLGTAIYGDPETRMKAGYYNAESNNANASAAKTRAETDGLNIKNTAATNLPATLGNLFAGPGSPLENLQKNIGSYATIVQANGGNSDDVARGLNTLFSTAAGLGDANDMTRSEVLQGKTPDQNFAPTPQRADQVAARNAKTEQAKSDSVARINQGGELNRLYAAPVTSRPGDTVYLAPNDPRRKVMGDNGVIQGAATVDTVRAKAGQDIAAMPADQAPSENLANVFSGGAGYKGATLKPKVVTGKSLNDAIMAGASMVPGAVNNQPNGKPLLSPDFEGAFDPQTVAHARSLAGAELSKSGDVQKAGEAYLAGLGVQPGSKFGPTGGFMGLFTHNAVSGPEGAAPAAPAVAAAPAVTLDQIPPPAQRTVGKTYPTPKGDMIWTPQGWLPAPSGKTY